MMMLDEVGDFRLAFIFLTVGVVWFAAVTIGWWFINRG